MTQPAAPPLPPTTRANNTPELDNHPSDHNQIVTALLALQPLGIVVPGTGFPGTGAFTTSPTYTNIGSVTWAGIAGRSYRVSGWWGFSSGASPATIQTQIVDVTPNAIQALPNVTCNAYWYQALAISWIVKCGVANRSIQVLLRSAATAGSTGAKAEIGYLSVEDVGRDAT